MSSQAPGPVISIVIPNFNGADKLETCLRSLQRQTRPGAEIIVVDNASQDDSLPVIRRVAPQAVIVSQTWNSGFAAGANAGVRAAQGDWVAVLNNDTEVAETWLEELVAALERHPDAAFLACRILDFKDRKRIYSAGDCFLRIGVGYRRGQELLDGPEYQEECEIFSASGCAALYRKSVFMEHEGYDDSFFAYLEDVDLALRLQAAGRRGYYAPRAAVFHLGGATSGGEFSPLAVRLRTRNALLLPIKSLPAPVFWRCLPMILAAQAVWLGRVLRRGRLWSYVRGLTGVLFLAPTMFKRRRRQAPCWREAPDRLWQALLRSEAMARKDFEHQGPENVSKFLSWYLRHCH